MWLRTLELLAFGPFTDTRLELGAAAQLHVVYGRNEAGKSSALRALSALLFGVDERTTDDHRHRKPDLRIGACLVGPDGAELQVVRRKGQKHTLLDAAGQPLDEGRLRELLQGLTPELFQSMYGLDHVRLREGGEDLLRGGGDVGASLFDAGVGGRGVYTLLERLDAESAELFTARGRNPRLNAALGAYKDARRAVAEREVTAGVWKKQEDALAEAQSRTLELERELRETAATLGRVRRVGRSLASLGKLRELRERRAALGNVVALPEDAGTARQDAQQELATCRRDAERLEAEIARHEARRTALHVQDGLAALDADVLAGLQDRLGRHRAAASDLPARCAERDGLRDEARRTLGGVARDVDLEGAEALRPNDAAKARVRGLARERGAIEQRLRDARHAAVEQERRLAEAEAQLARHADLPDVTALRAAVARVRSLADAEATAVQHDAAVRELEARGARALVGLHPWSGTLKDALGLPAPAAETLERFAQSFAECDTRQRRNAEQLEGLREQARALEAQLRELERAGEVPSQLGLAEARALRAKHWETVQRALLDPIRPADAAERAEAYDRASRAADDIADRLLAQAERVARHESLTSALAGVERARADAEHERARLAAERDGAHAEWLACWRPARVEPSSPAEMRGWLARLEQARELAAGLERACGDRDDFRSRVEAVAGAVCAALDVPRESIAQLLERAEMRLEEIADAKRGRAQLAAEIEELRMAAAAQRARARECEIAQRAWDEQWAASVRALRLGADATPDEADAVLTQLDRLFDRLDKEAAVRHRIDAMERDSAQLARNLDRLVDAHAPELAALELGERAERLLARAREAQSNRAQRTELDAELARARHELARLRAAEAAAAARLAQQIASAGVRTLDELIEAERRSQQARGYELEIASLESILLGQGDGHTLAELQAEAAALEASDLASVRAQLESRLEELESELALERQRVGSVQGGLERLREQNAVDASELAAAELARVRELAQRAVRVRLAAVLLRREIERYRQQNQGPVLERANTLFPRLTLGEWSGLSVGFSAADEPVLRCVRPDGGEVGVDGLSDGTRDQLYLALRLATLLHRVEHTDPLPLVLDDVLVHFDDERSRAALRVLGEVAGRLQVLLFTHHSRVVELAREVVPAARLRSHDLDALRGRAPL